MCIILRQLNQNCNELQIKHANLLSDSRLVTVRGVFMGGEKRTLSSTDMSHSAQKSFQKNLSDFITFVFLIG